MTTRDVIRGRRKKQPDPVAQVLDPLEGFAVGDFVVTPTGDWAFKLEAVGHDSMAGFRVSSVTEAGCEGEGSSSFSGLVSAAPGIALMHYDCYIVRVTRDELIASGLKRDALRGLARARVPDLREAVLLHGKAAEEAEAQRDRALALAEVRAVEVAAVLDELAEAQRLARELGTERDRALAWVAERDERLATQEAAATEVTRRLTQERDQARDALAQAHAQVDVLQRLTGELRQERDAARADASQALELRDRAEASEARLRRLLLEADARTLGLRADLDAACARRDALQRLVDLRREYSTPPPQVALVDDLAPAPCAGEPADAALAAQVGAAAADQSGEVTEMVEETAAVDPLEAARLIDAGTPPLLGSRPSPICGARNGHLFCERLADHAGEHVASDRADPVRWDAAPAFLVSQVRAGARAYKRQRVVAPIKPRRHPCPVCRRGAGEVHVCCPKCATRGRVTAVARTEEQVRALFGTRDNGTAAQPWCLVCRRETEAERRAAAQPGAAP